MSDELPTINKIAEAKRGIPRSAETKAKISASRRANSTKNHTTPHSEETKARMREAQKAAWIKRKAKSCTPTLVK